MTTQIRARWALTIFCILALAVASAAGDHDGAFEETLSVTGPADVEITTGSGNIDVRPGHDGRVHIRGLIKVDRRVSAEEADRIIQELVSHPPIEQSGSHIRIGQIKDWKLGGFLSISFDRHPFSISYELVVPAETRLTSDTGSGDMAVAGLKGGVKATTGSGSMRLSNLTGVVRPQAGSGNIEMSSVAGTVDAETGSGNITATGVSGAVRLRAGSGNLTVDQGALDSAEVETGSGDVQIRGMRGTLRATTGSGDVMVSGKPGGDWKVDTGSGSVTLRLSPQAAFTLNAHTGSGSIDSKVAITMQGKANRNELRGVAGAGGPLVSVQTGSGDIRIE